jgi:hypothetical protein
VPTITTQKKPFPAKTMTITSMSLLFQGAFVQLDPEIVESQGLLDSAWLAIG